MTAAAILKRYRRIAPVIGYKSSAWIQLLALAEAGETGLSRYEFHQLLRGRDDAAAKTLRTWKKAGLLVTGEVPAKSTTGGHPRLVYMATPKLYNALGLDPAERAIGPHK
jgi:hypothetical protein